MNALLSNPNTTSRPIYFADAFATKVNEGSGVAQLIKLARNILMIAREIMKDVGRVFYLPEVSRAISRLDTTFKTLIFNKAISSVVEWKKTLNNTLKNSSGMSEKLVRDTLEVATDALTISGMFGVGIAKASSITGLVSTLIDTKGHLEKVSKNDSAAEKNFESKCQIRRYLTPLTLGMIKNPILTEEDPTELRKIAMLKVAKDIISIVTGILAVVALVDIVFVSEIILLAVSTFSIILSLTTKVLEENTSHKVALLNLSN